MSHFAQTSIDRCLDLLIGVGCGEAGLFYSVGKDLQPTNFTLRAIDTQVQNRYKMHFSGLDPLQARHYWCSNLNLVSFERVPPHLRRQMDIFLNEFLIPASYSQVLEIFFRSQDRIVAGMSLLRHRADQPFTSEELVLIERAREFAEFRLLRENPLLAVLHDAEPLTAREVDILALLCSGYSNDSIASELSIATSTVKTHLRNIYGKLGVSNRKDLLIRLLCRPAPVNELRQMRATHGRSNA